MAKDTIVSSSKLVAIADAINAKTGGTSAMTLDEMAQEIAAIETGGGAGDAVLTALLTRQGSGNMEIPESLGITKIGNMVFQNVLGNYNLTIPEGITSIGNYAFRYAGILKIVLPKSLQTIGSDTFNGSLLEEVVIDPQAALVSIGASAFLNSKIQSIVIPAGVTSIGSMGLGGTASLMDIYCYPTTPPALADRYAIEDRSNLKIHIPAGTKTAYKSATNWSALSCEFKEDL